MNAHPLHHPTVDSHSFENSPEAKPVALVHDLKDTLVPMGNELDIDGNYQLRSSAESESPREDYRYKNVSRQKDGLFHCPWEGQAGCNHKPEKLKCNYE